MVKLADQYDNLSDCAYLDAAGRKKTARKVRSYIDAVRNGLPPDGKRGASSLSRRNSPS